ncbi:MAG: CoA-disulfide reductase [Mycoplasmatales bacterium]
MKTVIIGGNAAGMSFAAKYRRNNPNNEIIVLEQRDYVSFGGCGLPYFVGDFFTNKDRMIARTVEKTLESGIDIRINSLVTAVDFEQKIVSYKDVKDTNSSQIVQTIAYDELIISTGATPIVPNFGEYSPNNVFTLTTMEDGIDLKKALEKPSVKKVAIIGAGFIGLELVEAFKHRGLEVVLIERESAPMNKVFSTKITDKIIDYLDELQVEVHLNTTVSQIEDLESGYKIITDSSEIKADLIVLSLGFKPNTEIFDLEKAANGALMVDKFSQTKLSNVYAVGDCALTYNSVTEKMQYIPLATAANKIGRMLADKMAGKKVVYNGMLGSSCLKLHELELAATGMSEMQALELGIDYKVVAITDKDHTSYYPGQADIHINLLYDAQTKVILGAEALGKNGVVGRINVIAAAITTKMTTEELGYLDLCYAPPFSRTWDALNVAGNVAK